MNLNNLNPFIRYAKKLIYNKPNKANSVCYDCRIFYILHGKGTFVANDVPYQISSDSLIYLPPKTRYNFFFNDSKASTLYVIDFDLVDTFQHVNHSLGVDTEKKFNPLLAPDYEILSGFENPIVKTNQISKKTNISNCIEMFLHKDINYAYYSSANLKITLLDLLKSESTENKLAQDVIQYIQSEYASPELDNQIIADHFHYHPYHLNRVVKAYTNKTLHGYLIDYRLRIAKDLLLSSNLSVTEIAEKTGFSSYSYFIKTFKEKNGSSPKVYRDKSKML